MKICEMCGADISSRAASAKYCFSCAVKAQRERVKNCKAKNKEKIRDYQKEYYARNKEKNNRLRREQYAEKSGITPAEQERLEEEESWRLTNLHSCSTRQRRTRRRNAISTTRRKRTGCRKVGIVVARYSAIRHMVVPSANGSKRHSKNQNVVIRSSCFSPPGRTLYISMNTFMEKRKFVSCAAGYGSRTTTGTLPIQRHSLQW